MRKIAFSIVTLFFVIISAYAVPAKPGVWKNLRLTDGTSVLAEQKGDEHLSFWKAKDGRIFQATSTKDVYQAVSQDLLKTQWNEAIQKDNLQKMSARKVMKKEYAIPSKLKGTFKGLVILVDFQDVKFKDGHTRTFFNELLNTNKLSKEGYPGSVHDYFYDQSSGEFNITFDVVGPYTMSHDTKYYGENFSDIKYDSNHKEMIIEACNAAYSENVDFSKYVWYDNSNEVELVYVLYAGKGENEDISIKDNLWPKQAWLNDKAQNYNGTLVNTYAISNESDGIGTFCHEFSHCLGLPDVYDVINETGNKKYGIGHWDLMDQGNYNGNGKCPPNYSSYERYFCGWLTPFNMDGQREVRQMKSLNDSQEAYAIYNPANRNELFLLENRDATKWDKHLPNKGLLIWHIYYEKELWKDDYINNVEDHPLYYIVPADDDRTENTEAGDAYPHANNNEFGVTSRPLANFYDADENGIRYPDYDVKNISYEDGLASFDFKLPLTVGKILLEQFNYSDDILLGTTLSGTVNVKNNGFKSYSGNITIGLFDETTQRYREIQNDYPIEKLSDYTIAFKYEGLEPGHTYNIYVAYNYSNEIYRFRSFTCQTDVPLLEAVSLELDNGNLSEKTFTGTTMSGHLELQNNNFKTNRDYVYVFVVEEGDTQKLNPDMNPIYCDLFVHPHKTQTIFFDFNQLLEGHRYAVAVTNFEMNEFYRSDYFTCLPDPNASETLAVGSCFKSTTEDGLELTFRVISNSPKLVEIGSESKETYENAATDKDFSGHVTIPSSVNGYTVSRLANWAFYGMNGMTSVTIPSTVREIGISVFVWCKNLTRIDGMEAVETIGHTTFKGCRKLKTISFPHTLRFLGKQAISDNDALEYVVIPSSLTTIEDESLLLNCPMLRSVVVERGNPVYDSRGGCNAIIKSATNEVVAGCTTTTIPFGVTKITNLNWVDNLERIELPPTVTEIDEYAFWCTSELKTVLSHIKNPMPIANGKTFYAPNQDITSYLTLYVPKGCKAKYQATEGWKDFVDIREMSEHTEMLRYFYNGWTYTLNKQAVGSGARSTHKTETGTGNVRTDADGWEMYRSLLTLDVTDDKGETKTYTVDEGDVFLDLSEYGTLQKATMLMDNAANKIWIFTNSKSEGDNYNMDGYMYSASLDKLEFEKETVFENQDQGWYANLEQGDNGQLQLNHYDMSEYVEVSTERQEDATYVSEVSDDIVTPAEAEENWNESIKLPEPGDLDGDGKMGFVDLAAIINALGRKDCDASTDVNGDSRVDIADILTFLKKKTINDYLEKIEAVDLGLPSGLLWSNCNLGATSPEEIGNFYAWGEITPKSEYTSNNYIFYDPLQNTYSDLGNVGNISGMAEYDAATTLMGLSWRMPTYYEFYELNNYCELEWATVNNIPGIRITGSNGNSIFMPATHYDNGFGYYWSSIQYNSEKAVSLYFNVTKQQISWALTNYRYNGFPIRPVKK